MARAARAVVKERGLERTGVDVIAITAQMFNLVAVDEVGEPVLPMLSWLDTRSSSASRGARTERSRRPTSSAARLRW
jgi:sugar (pentulose or hexulose) kinase